MTDEPITPVKAPRKRTAPKKDERIIGATTIQKEAAPAEFQRAWLEWYDSHTEKEKALIDETMNRMKYANTGVGYRIVMHTYAAWEKMGIVGGKKARTRF